MILLKKSLTLASVFALTPLLCTAATIQWSPVNGNEFGTDSNWDGGVAPGSGDIALLAKKAEAPSTYITVLNNESVNVSGIHLNDKVSNLSLLQSGGTVTISGSSMLVLGRGAGTDGAYFLTGGTLDVASGSLAAADDLPALSGAIAIGASAGGKGYFSISGAAQLIAKGDLRIGTYNSEGGFYQDGGTVTVQNDFKV